MLGLLALVLLANPAWAQSTETEQFLQEIVPQIQALGRAQNLARMAGERANGGLEVYRAEPSMFGNASEAPYTELPDAWIFRFQGGSPGASVRTIETEVRVNRDTFTTTVLYNGPIRSGVVPPVSSQLPPAQPLQPLPNPPQTFEFQPLPEAAPVMPILPTAAMPTTAPVAPATDDSIRLTEAIFGLSRAQNLARQAGERVNGGLQVYRVENAMHGNAANSPFVDSGDAWIFRFRGGAPGTALNTIETEVRVDKATFETSVIYNGAPR